MIRLKHLLTENTIETAIYWAKTFQADLELTPEAASAMAANIQHESGFLPHRIQGSGVKTGTMADSGNLGYSWAQWTYPARKQAYRDHVLNKFKVDIKKKPAQIIHAYSFLKSEIDNYPGFDFDVFKKSKDLDAATKDFVTNYEQAVTPMLKHRQELAREILNKIKPKSKKPGDTWKDAVQHVVDMATNIGGTKKLSATDCTMYPNPATTNGPVSIKINKAKLPIQSIDLAIFSAYGKSYGKHHWDNIQQGILKFNAPADRGVYVIRLSNDVALKLIVQ